MRKLFRRQERLAAPCPACEQPIEVGVTHEGQRWHMECLAGSSEGGTLMDRGPPPGRSNQAEEGLLFLCLDFFLENLVPIATAVGISVTIGGAIALIPAHLFFEGSSWYLAVILLGTLGGLLVALLALLMQLSAALSTALPLLLIAGLIGTASKVYKHLAGRRQTR